MFRGGGREESYAVGGARQFKGYILPNHALSAKVEIRTRTHRRAALIIHMIGLLNCQVREGLTHPRERGGGGAGSTTTTTTTQTWPAAATRQLQPSTYYYIHISVSQRRLIVFQTDSNAAVFGRTKIK